MPFEQSRAIVRAECLLALEPFIEVTQVRHYLNGIYIAPHPTQGALLTVTDGHTLGLLYDPCGIVAGPPQIWSREICKTLKPLITAAKKSRQSVTDNPLWIDLSWPGEGATTFRLGYAGTAKDMLDDENSVLSSHTARSESFRIDGTFPDIVRVFPNAGGPSELSLPVAIQAGYLKRAASLAKALHVLNTGLRDAVGDYARVVVVPNGNGPAWIRFQHSSDENAIAGAMLIMPVTERDDPFFHPTWLLEIVEARRAEDEAGNAITTKDKVA